MSLPTCTIRSRKASCRHYLLSLALHLAKKSPSNLASTPAQAAKVLKDLHERREIDGKASGKV